MYVRFRMPISEDVLSWVGKVGQSVQLCMHVHLTRRMSTYCVIFAAWWLVMLIGRQIAPFVGDSCAWSERLRDWSSTWSSQHCYDEPWWHHPFACGGFGVPWDVGKQQRHSCLNMIYHISHSQYVVWRGFHFVVSYHYVPLPLCIARIRLWRCCSISFLGVVLVVGPLNVFDLWNMGLKMFWGATEPLTETTRFDLPSCFMRSISTISWACVFVFGDLCLWDLHSTLDSTVTSAGISCGTTWRPRD